MDVLFGKMLAEVPGSWKELKILLLPFRHEIENSQDIASRTFPIIDILNVILINYFWIVRKSNSQLKKSKRSRRSKEERQKVSSCYIQISP